MDDEQLNVEPLGRACFGVSFVVPVQPKPPVSLSPRGNQHVVEGHTSPKGRQTLTVLCVGFTGLKRDGN